MKKLVKVAIVVGVGALVAKKVVDYRKAKKAKMDEVFEAKEEEKEVVDVECEDVDNDDEWEWEYYDDPEYIVPQQRRVRKNGKAVNDNIQGAAKFDGFKAIDKWLEKYERKVIDYFKENPDAGANVFIGFIGILYFRRYGLIGLIGYALFIRMGMKYGREMAGINC